MSRTTFSGPVKSDNGFEGDIVGDAVAASSLTIGGSLVISSGWNAASGTASAQVGFIPVSIGGVTKYIALYSSVTV
jgi:hypothetical protein